MSTEFVTGQKLDTRWNRIASGSERPLEYEAPQQIWVSDKVPTSLDGPNLIANPNFEVDTAGWAALAGGSIARTTTYKYSGVAGATVTSSAIGDGTKYALDLEPNQYYVFGAKIARAYNIILEMSDLVDITAAVNTGITNGGFDWVTVRGTFFTDSTHTSCELRAKNNTATVGQTFQLDNVYVRRAQLNSTLNASLDLPWPEWFAYDGRDWSRAVRGMRLLAASGNIALNKVITPNYQRTYYQDGFQIPPTSGVLIRQRFRQAAGGSGTPANAVAVYLNGSSQYSVSINHGSDALTVEYGGEVEFYLSPRYQYIEVLSGAINTKSVSRSQNSYGYTAAAGAYGQLRSYGGGVTTIPEVITSIDLRARVNASNSNQTQYFGPTQIFEVLGAN